MQRGFRAPIARSAVAMGDGAGRIWRLRRKLKLNGPIQGVEQGKGPNKSGRIRTISEKLSALAKLANANRADGEFAAGDARHGVECAASGERERKGYSQN